MTPTKARTLQEHLHNQLQQLIAVDFPNGNGKCGEIFSAFMLHNISLFHLLTEIFSLSEWFQR